MNTAGNPPTNVPLAYYAEPMGTISPFIRLLGWTTVIYAVLYSSARLVDISMEHYSPADREQALLVSCPSLLILAAGIALLSRNPIAIYLMLIGAVGITVCCCWAIRLCFQFGFPATTIIGSTALMINTTFLPAATLLIAVCLPVVRRNLQSLLQSSGPIERANDIVQAITFLAWTAILLGVLEMSDLVIALNMHVWAVRLALPACAEVAVLSAGSCLLLRRRAAIPLLIGSTASRMLLTIWYFAALLRGFPPGTLLSPNYVIDEVVGYAQMLVLPGMLFAAAFIPDIRRGLHRSPR